jgi:hypothetical protein
MRILVLICLFTSCYDGEINGRKYQLEWNCVESHLLYGTRIVPCGKIMISQPYTYSICDTGYYDTIWIKQ